MELMKIIDKIMSGTYYKDPTESGWYEMRYHERLGLEKWLHQNKAILDDCITGTLNDDCYYCGKRGFIAVIWVFETTWTSKAIAFFAPYKNQEACKKLWEMWDARRVAAECVPD